MKKLQIHILQNNNISYPIFIGDGILLKINSLLNLSQFSRVVVITDKIVEKLFLKNVQEFLPSGTRFIVLPTGESVKNIECAEGIWKELFENGCDRKSIVINIGGGVITDIGGFAASTYMRGIPFVNVPTTLLSQVDASVGGKTGINFDEIKNLVGTFSQPLGVIIDTLFLETLPKREFISGFGEIIKHGIITDRKYFDLVTQKHPLDFTKEELISIIEKSCRIKATFIESDEKEGKLRRTVNFGHTIGHAIESISLETENPLYHGEAVSIGMVAESYISVFLHLLSEEDAKTIKNSLQEAGLPIVYKISDTKKILKKIRGDKKNENGVINFTLLKKIGEAMVNQKVEDTIIERALQKIQYI